MFSQTVLGGWYKCSANEALMGIANLSNAELPIPVRKMLTDIIHFVCAVLRQMVYGLPRVARSPRLFAVAAGAPRVQTEVRMSA